MYKESLMQSLDSKRLVGALLVALCLVAPGMSMAQNQQYGSDYIIVAPGMTLTRIMREYYPQHRKHWPALMDEVIRINPHAFVNGAPASLKRGMRLTLPKEVPTTRTTRQAAGTAAPKTQTSRQSTVPVVTATAGTAAATTGGTRSTAGVASSAASQQPATATRQQAAAAPQQQPTTQTIQGASRITVQEPVAALPPPIQTDLSGAGDQGTVGSGQVVAQEAPQGGSKERPPWWWILSAVAMLALVL
jgi:Tfp pilus assembly protein FimV